MIKLSYTIPEEHKPFSGIETIDITMFDECTVQELVEGFEKFMHSIGYSTDVKLDFYTEDQQQETQLEMDLSYDRNRKTDNDEEEVLGGC